MKQFILANQLIVICIGVAALALLAVVFPVYEVGQLQTNLSRLRDRSGEESRAISTAESPQWLDLQRQQIAKVKDLQEAVNQTALELYREPLRVNGRVILPKPEQADRFSFQKAYLDVFPGWLADLKATTPPTLDDINKATEVEKARTLAGHPVRDPVSGLHEPLTAAEEAACAQRAREYLINRRLEGKLIYASILRFDQYLKPTAEWKPLDDRDLWQAQLNYWVQKDLVEAIRRVNTAPLRHSDGTEGNPPANVRQAPVKELVWVDVQEDYYRGPGASGRPTPTGHVTGVNYDVLLFSFQVVMDIRQAPQLVGALSVQNFNTVLSVQYDTLEHKGGTRGAGGASSDRSGSGAREEFYDYGSDPVMAVTFNCESVFMKSPLSWRDGTADGQAKRIRFLEANPRMVLKLIQNGRELPLEADLAKRGGQIEKLLAGDPTIKVIALYEDLIPEEIRRGLPGLQAVATPPTSGGPRRVP